MKTISRKGVLRFFINPQEYPFIKESFFKDKQFLKTTPNGEVWGYNFKVEPLLVKGQEVFGVVCPRDFYSQNKEEIFNELKLIERREGVSTLETAPFRYYTGAIQNGEMIGHGLPQLGDLLNGKKLAHISFDYDFQTNIYRGYYGI